jgi:hypothetical protein
MTLRFRNDFEDVLLTYAARARRSAGPSESTREPSFEVLSPAHPDSPFLTLAEWDGDEPEGRLPSWVVKILVVLADDPSAPFWHQVLEREQARWRHELAERLALPRRVETLGLPLSVALYDSISEVEIGEIGPLPRTEVLATTSQTPYVRFSYLVRPYVAWPRLVDVGYSTDQLLERWELYSEEHAIAAPLVERLFPHFCDEALTDERRDILLSSAWRLEVGA